MNVKDAFYHGIRQQIRRVLEAMGEERVAMGLTAFDTGASNWGSCFFARAYPEVKLGHKEDPEEQVATLLGMPGNKVPMRIVYKTFDGLSWTISKGALHEFIKSFLDEQRSAAVDASVEALLRSIDYSDVEDKPVNFNLVCTP